MLVRLPKAPSQLGKAYRHFFALTRKLRQQRRFNGMDAIVLALERVADLFAHLTLLPGQLVAGRVFQPSTQPSFQRGLAPQQHAQHQHERHHNRQHDTRRQ